MNSLQHRLIKFSLAVYKFLQPVKHDQLLGPSATQLMRSATSTGANYSEAQATGSYRDFHNKVRIALKELKEAQFWIGFFKEALGQSDEISHLEEETLELIRILSTISKKMELKKQQGRVT